MLFTNHIPYRYECLLPLGDISFYPDFTILNPSTRQIIYWEHFGMMDVPTYSDNAFNKLKQFSYYGIIPGINLITTYETKQHPIDSGKIMQLVTTYFSLQILLRHLGIATNLFTPTPNFYSYRLLGIRAVFYNLLPNFSAIILIFRYWKKYSTSNT